MAGARSLWRAAGMKENQMDQPIIGIANSFTQFVPGHTHLHPVGQQVKALIEARGCFAAEFNTIAVDDGIAMGHDGMLYSLPSREVIADSVEYMANAHKVDGLICISNCDKITPGMMMAVMRLNLPAVMVSGGPMEAGKIDGKSIDLVDAMVVGGDHNFEENTVTAYEMAACPTCGSCSGMFTANSMNCLAEALGLALPGNGSVVATHKNRSALFEKAAETIVELCRRYYEEEDHSVLPRSVATRESFENAMALDIAMGGSTNTVLHLLAVAREAEVSFTMKDINRLSRKIPNLCKVAPSSSYHMEDVHRAGGVLNILAELAKGGLIHEEVNRIDAPSLGELLKERDLTRKDLAPAVEKFYRSAPGGVPSQTMGSQDRYYKTADTDREKGCIRSIPHAYSRDGGLAVLYGNIAPNGCIVKTAGVDPSIYRFQGPARVFSSQEAACKGILKKNNIKEGDVIVIRYEGPKGGPGMQEMLYPTSYIKAMGLGKKCALITDGRFSGGTSGLSIGHISPEAAAGGNLALVQSGDIIEIDILKRKIRVKLSEKELKERRREEERKRAPFRARGRKRKISKALKAYSLLVSSADKGAVRIV